MAATIKVQVPGEIIMAMGGRSGETFSEINVTPWTDVFLVLLVIMILVAPLVNQTVLKVSSPVGPGCGAQTAGPQVVVDVTKAGLVKVKACQSILPIR